MKYAIIIPDGAADEPLVELAGKTPLQAARLPAMDAVVTQGVVGTANHVPPHLPAGSDVANMSLLGYDPDTYFSGRAPLEAAAQGIQLGSEDWAIRCNLVTIVDQTMREFTAGHITTEEARLLLTALQAAVPRGELEFVTGVSYRNLLLHRPPRGQHAPYSRDTRTTPPHDLTDQSVQDAYPRGPGSELLHELMALSVDVFAHHPVNQARIAQGKPAATNVWLWGLGKRPALAPFAQLFGKRGAMISAVDLLFGLAELVGWKRINVPGATGYLDTDYAAKGSYAINALQDVDLVCVHVEAPDEASHMGDYRAKIKAVEEIDQKIVGPLHQALKQMGDYRILITPDHPTTIRSKTHSHGIVPFAACGAGIPQGKQTTYDEAAARESGLSFPQGCQLMPWFLES